MKQELDALPHIGRQFYELSEIVRLTKQLLHRSLIAYPGEVAS